MLSVYWEATRGSPANLLLYTPWPVFSNGLTHTQAAARSGADQCVKYLLQMAEKECKGTGYGNGWYPVGFVQSLSSQCFLPAPRAIRTPILQRKPAALEDLKHYSFSCWKPPLKGALSVEAPARRSKECDREMAKFESSLNGPATQMTWAQ